MAKSSQRVSCILLHSDLLLETIANGLVTLFRRLHNTLPVIIACLIALQNDIFTNACE